MKKLNNNNLVIGKRYWVLYFKNNLTPTRLYSKDDINDLILDDTIIQCTYVTECKRNSISLLYFFSPINNKDSWCEIDSSTLNTYVFEEYEDCLISLYKLTQCFLNKQNKIHINSSFLEKIKESQEKHPEKWIL